MELKTITTERLILRRFTPADFNHVFTHYPEKEIKALLGLQTDEAFLKEKEKNRKGYSTHNRSIEYFQLLDKTTKQIIGSCQFHNWYADHRRAELGYAFTNEDFKGKGLMTEALIEIIDHGFNQMKLHRMEAFVGATNTPSLRIMEKFNFEREGYLKQHYFINNKFEDSVLFSLLSANYSGK